MDAFKVGTVEQATALLNAHVGTLLEDSRWAHCPIVVVCERNKGWEAGHVANLVRDKAGQAKVIQIKQTDSLGGEVAGWWTTADEKLRYGTSLMDHLSSRCDVFFADKFFSSYPTSPTRTVEELALANKDKLVAQLKRLQCAEPDTRSAIGVPRVGLSGCFSNDLRLNTAANDDLAIAFGLALRLLDGIIEKTLPRFPYYALYA